MDMTWNDCINYQLIQWVLETWNEKCKPIETEFWWETIQNILAGKWYDIVAYAPYNTDNYDMKINWSPIIWNNESLYISNSIYQHRYNPATTFFIDGSISCTNIHDTQLHNTWFPVSGNIFSSLYVWWDYGNWVFLDNSNLGALFNDYLKYNISSLGLSPSWSWFAIEMSVRWASLKRTGSGTYTLFSNGTSGPKLYLNNSRLYVWTSLYISLTPDLKNQLETHNFYKVVFEYKNWTRTLSLYDDYTLLQEVSNSMTISSVNNLYIWWEQSSCSAFWYTYTCYINQWNDIIDYVKIYKKDSSPASAPSPITTRAAWWGVWPIIEVIRGAWGWLNVHTVPWG
jgi:hypothetical protein